VRQQIELSLKKLELLKHEKGDLTKKYQKKKILNKYNSREIEDKMMDDATRHPFFFLTVF
jgi:hypothetical protein